MQKQANKIKNHLRPGQVYRRSDLMKWSNAVDRHLKQLQNDGALTKLSGGLYYYPKGSSFGPTPADDRKVITAFLNDHRFLVFSQNAYNTLGVGTTQLYNETIVYNHKRHGRFQLGGRYYDFRIKPHFPSKITKEFLLIDLLNNLDRLAEDTESLMQRLQVKLDTTGDKKLSRMAREYGSVRTRKLFQ